MQEPSLIASERHDFAGRKRLLKRAVALDLPDIRTAERAELESAATMLGRWLTTRDSLPRCAVRRFFLYEEASFTGPALVRGLVSFDGRGWASNEEIDPGDVGYARVEFAEFEMLEGNKFVTGWRPVRVLKA